MASGKGDHSMSGNATEFSLDVYKHIAKQSPKENVFISPSSVFVVMTMVHYGAKKNTLAEMTKAMKFGGKGQKEVLESVGKFADILKKGSKSVTLTSANRLYPDVGKDIQDEYISMVTKHFGADVKPMDYTKFEEARLEINKWVEEETRQKIRDLLPSGSLNSLTRMVVVNAIYFKGNWATQFDAKVTKKMDFQAENGKVKVDMMRKEMKKVKYGQSSKLNCKVLELPYEGEELAMIFILPSEATGLLALEQQLDVKNLSELINDVHSPTVDVGIPKFKMGYSIEMKSVLSAIGMPELFNVAKADLSGMGKELYVSAVFHKAFVDVNEEGTEAAAATAAIMMTRSLPPRPQSFIADHPFLFMIWDHRLEAPLFVGRYVQPESSDSQQKEEL